MFRMFHEVSRKATAPAHAPYLRPVGNSPAIAAIFGTNWGHSSQRKTIMTCLEYPWRLLMLNKFQTITIRVPAK